MSQPRIGKFTVLAELGVGAGSRVFHVRREADSREYALKVIAVTTKQQRKFLDQVRHEFRVGQMLDHPNLIKVYSLETETDWLFRPRQARLLLEHVPGRTLDKVPPLNMPRLLRVFEQVVDALGHMHARGVFHADLKPGNLILGPGVDVKVIDYGLSWIEGEPKDRLQGTLEYMAPETQAHKVINRRTDIFNLGATMYRLVTLRSLPSLSTGLVLDERSYRRLVVPVARLRPDTPPGLCDLIHWCIEHNPANRPRHLAELQAAFAQVASEGEGG